MGPSDLRWTFCSNRSGSMAIVSRFGPGSSLLVHWYSYRTKTGRGRGVVGGVLMYELLEEALGIHFQNPAFLKLALTHRSYIYETPGAGQISNERLEFLGDSILTFISADFLYRTFPELSEGELTDVRAALVKTETLAIFARDLALGNFLLMGKGEQN